MSRSAERSLLPMLVIEDAWHRDDYPRPTVATVGNFDGLHRGQQLIVQRVTSSARARGVAAAVVTFEPHPLAVLRPERPPQRITTAEQKRQLLRRLGIDVLAVIRFTPEFATTSADRFVEEFLHRRLGIKELYVGSRFALGHHREGDLERLRHLAERLGFELEGVEELACDGDTVSSTRIRQAVRDGEVAKAVRMLGRPFAITGRVVHGEGRGKDHGWPTINIEPEHELLPADGVYAAQVWLAGRARVLPAVTNVGQRPTFPDGDRRVVEAHLFDFHEEIYGEKVELGFVERLRGERRFPSVDELAKQISRDAILAREYLTEESCPKLVPTIVE